MSLRCALLASLLLVTSPSFAIAQTAETPAETAAKDQQAYELLETIAAGISSLRNVENRIYLGATVADLLWNKDEKRARALFGTVTSEVVSEMSALDPTDEHQQQNYGMIYQRRREVVDRMARRDPEMALAFLRATRPATESSDQLKQNEAQLELHLAGLIAGKDPTQALRIARANLRKGISYSLMHLIPQIDAKDRAAAQSLHSEIIERLKNEDLRRNYDLANSAWHLLSAYQPPQANEQTYRGLLEFIAGFILSVSATDTASVNFAQNSYHQVNSAIPYFEKYAPGRVVPLKQWLRSVQRTQDPTSQMNQELNEAVRKGTVDNILALAGKYPEHQTNIYQQAASKALSSGDPNRARQIISEMVTDPAQRRQMLEQLDNQLTWNTISQNKIAEARAMLPRVKTVEQQVQLLMSMAITVANKGDKQQALELLAEARTMLDSAPLDSGKMSARLQLAQSYSTLDSDQSVALMESMIVHLNQLVAAAAVLDGFESRYLKNGEWMRAGYTSLGNLINTFDQNLGQIARHNVAGARQVSNQIERPELRMMAQLEIAQSLLAGAGPANRNAFRRFGRIR